jgi:hypothetical protein
LVAIAVFDGLGHYGEYLPLVRVHDCPLQYLVAVGGLTVTVGFVQALFTVDGFGAVVLGAVYGAIEGALGQGS